ncbi:MAG: hypothetical protein GXY33_14615 [Phycisphaerae bacterium]|nr:hypothetical protein [Phycisphaerae bacterium]
MALDASEQPAPDAEPPDELRRIVEALTEQDKVLIVCNEEFYGGRWDLLRQDLRDRLEGRPYVLSLGQRINDDLQRAGRLEEIETKFNVKLADLISL